MRWPIRIQLLWPMLAVMALTILLVGAAVTYWRISQVRAQQKDNLQRVATTLVEGSFPLSEQVLQQMRGLSGAEFVLLGGNSEIVTTTLDISPEVHRRLRELPLDRVLDDLAEQPKIVIGTRQYLATRTPLVRPLPSGGPGSLAILYPEDQILAEAHRAAWPALLAVVAIAVVVVVVTTLLAQRFVKPIRTLGDRTAAIARGDFTPLPVTPRDDEIRDLTVAINQMTKTLSQYETEIRRSEQLRTLHQLGAGMAHQLRNSAAGALMAIELHQRQCPASADSESLEVARTQLKLMSSYLQRFLTLGQSRPASTDRLALQQLVCEVIKLVEPACAHAKIELTHQWPEQPLMIEGDAETLRQVLINLLLNAVDAARAKNGTPGRVIVGIRADENNRAILEIKDSGPGPNQSVEGRIFEPFVSEKPDGTGLGLFVARQVVEQHRGTIDWRREQDLTCFTVELPLCSTAL